MKNHGTALEWSNSQIAEAGGIVLRALPRSLRGVDPKDVLPVLQRSGEILEREMRKAIIKAGYGVIELGEFIVVLEGTHTTSELIEIGGFACYDSSIGDRLFPLEKHEPTERRIILLKFYESICPKPTDAMAHKVFELLGFKHPTYEDALYFAVQYPEEHWRRPIAFLFDPVPTSSGGYKSFGLTKHLQVLKRLSFDTQYPKKGESRHGSWAFAAIHP